MNSNILVYLQLYQRLGLTPIPLKPRSKEPLVKWGDGWNPSPAELKQWAAKPGINWGVRCGPQLVVLDFDTADAFYSFLQTHPEAGSWPRSRTGRGHHIWVKPRKPVRSQRLDGVEVKCLGSYVVAPPSIHPNGTDYTFEVAPDGSLPEVDLEDLLGVPQGKVEDKVYRVTLPGNGGVRLTELEKLPPHPLEKVGGKGEYRTRCIFHHPDDNPSLYINPGKGVFHCFGCGQKGTLHQFMAVLGSKPSVNNFPAWAEKLRDRVVAALRELGDSRAQKVADCHQLWRIYPCPHCRRYPAFPVSCGFSFDPFCRIRRLWRFFSEHAEAFHRMGHPVGVSFDIPPMRVDPEGNTASQTQRYMGQLLARLRGLAEKKFTEMLDMKRCWEPEARNGSIGGRLHLVFELPDCLRL
jgi:hypothetical protein